MAVTTCLGGPRSLRSSAPAEGGIESGNSIVKMMKRLPFSKGARRRGRPSPLTAFIMRVCLVDSGSLMTKSLAPRDEDLAAIACSVVHCLKTVLPPRCTKQPMHLPLSCPLATAFLHTLRSSVSATAALSSDGQSQSSYISQSAASPSSRKGSYVTGLITSPGVDLMISVRPSSEASSMLK